MSSLVFDLEQGWTKGLEIQFCNMKESLNIDPAEHYSLKQVHSAAIEAWSPQSQSGMVEADGWFARGDVFKSNRRYLLIKTADCLPMVYVDRERESVVVIHAGWRGLQQGIHLKPFENQLCDPRDTWVWIGPSLNGRNFEVGEDMWSQFGDKSRQPKYFEPHSGDTSKRFFHVWDFVEDSLRERGVELIYNVCIDTFEERSFVSWRRAKNAGVSQLKVHNYTRVSFVK